MISKPTAIGHSIGSGPRVLLETDKSSDDIGYSRADQVSGDPPWFVARAIVCCSSSAERSCLVKTVANGSNLCQASLNPGHRVPHAAPGRGKASANAQTIFTLALPSMASLTPELAKKILDLRLSTRSAIPPSPLTSTSRRNNNRTKRHQPLNHLLVLH